MNSRIVASLPMTAIALAALAALTGCSESTASEAPVLQAAAVIRDAAGNTVGSATLAQRRSGGVDLRVNVAGLSVGTHGIHIHAVGSCEASGGTAFGAAGGHFNPMQKSHGLDSQQGAHGGDLPNLQVADGGAGRLVTTTDRVTLTPGPISILDADGAALVIHAGPDDQVSDPAGNSGGRIACGVIQAR